MRKFKTLDYKISTILIIAFVPLSFILQDFTFIVGYFVVGTWQCISMLVHVYYKWFTSFGNARNIYHWITLFSVLTIPVGSYIILLFTAPFMAIYYTYLCYHEVSVKMQRPLALLK